MSIYSQNMYGQPPYNGPAYTSHPPASAGYYYTPPQPHPAPAQYPLDVVSFRREYTRRLSELTLNSRPIIQGLSVFAQEYSRYADVVAQCLESHIRRVPPWMKLPAWYLLDAISKNVYEPFARHFSNFVVPLFLDTYPQVDNVTRSKMEEMLLTWRTGSPTGNELFGVQQQMAIERGVWGGSNNGNTQGGANVITRSQVLSELQFTLGQKERAVHVNPFDTVSQNHITILNQLRMHVETGVSQEELRQILNQLRNLVRAAPPPPPPPPPAHIPQAPSQPLAPAVAAWHVPPPFPPQLPAASIPSTTTFPHQPFASTLSVVKQEEQPVASTSTPATAVSPDNIANLLSTLLKAGVVSANATPTGAGSSAKEQSHPSLDDSDNIEAKSSAVREHRNTILSDKVNLQNLEALSSSRIIDVLYDRQNLQCKQCGIRFPDTKPGKKDQDDHLDMHFRQNRKANDDIGRGHSRSWFIGVEDWIQDISIPKKGKGRADSSGRLNSKALAAENAQREAELRAQYVVAPPDNEAQVISCPICKESLVLEFLEEEEEWAWKNATKKDHKVYHATCYAEAMASTSSLAARLRTEKIHGSRSATPEVIPLSSEVRATPPRTLKNRGSRSPSRSPLSESKVTGTKRKVEQSQFDALDEASGTPPFKKVALTSTTVSS